MGGWSWGSGLVKAREGPFLRGGPFSLVPGELRAPGQEERVRVDLQGSAEQDRHPWGAAFLRESLPTLVREGEGSWGGAASRPSPRTVIHQMPTAPCPELQETGAGMEVGRGCLCSVLTSAWLLCVDCFESGGAVFPSLLNPHSRFHPASFRALPCAGVRGGGLGGHGGASLPLGGSCPLCPMQGVGEVSGRAEPAPGGHVSLWHSPRGSACPSRKAWFLTSLKVTASARAHRFSP